MWCPVCVESPLITVEYDEIELDYCQACAGVWLDEGELELLFGDAEACAAFLSIGSPAGPHREKTRRCPMCGVKMVKEAAESAPPVLFDRCPHDHGLWLDGGELEQVLRQGGAQALDSRLTAWLRDVFGASASE